MTLWMLYAVAFGCLAAAAAMALDRGARALGRPARFIWVAALAVAIVGPFAVPRWIARVPSQAPSAETASLQPAAGGVSPVARDAATGPTVAERLRAFDRPATVFWIGLSIILLLRFARSVLALRRKRPEWIAHEVDGTALLVTPDIGPAVVAMPRSNIVVPEWILSLDAASLATVVRHEREHTAAGDAWLIMIASITAAAFPWNPAVWLMRRRLRLAIEVDCDARVLAAGGRVDHYGSLLLRIAERPRLANGFAATLTEPSSDLERRIEAMTARRPQFPYFRAALFVAPALVALGLACEMPRPDMTSPDKTIAGSGNPMYDFNVERPAAADPNNAPPHYPDSLRARGIEGTVIAKFVVDTSGRIEPRTFEIVSADHPAFAEAVRNHVPNMRFWPAQVGQGRKVRQLVQMPFSFALAGGGRNVTGTAAVIRARRPEVRSGSTSGDTVPQQLASNVPPKYPNQLRAANIEGQVLASFVVRVDGSVDMSTFRILKSDHDAFTASVREAVARLKFRPAVKDGQAVAVSMQMPFVFSLVR